MGRVASLLTVLLAAAAANAASLPAVVARANYAVKERHPVPRKWKTVGPAPADHVINLSISLKQSQFEELEKHLYQVSDPFHERYGQHLSKEEVNNLVKPSDETSQLVHEWLAEFGIEASRLSYSSSGDTLTVALPVAEVEQLLDTEYSVFEHEEEGSYVVRTPEFSLPVHLHEHIMTIQPTNSFFRVKPMRTTVKTSGELFFGTPPVLPQLPHPGQTIAEVCNETFVTPLCLRTLYGTVDYKPQVPNKNLVGWNNFLNETAIRTDVELFLEEFRPDASVSIVKNLKPHIIDNGSDIQMVFPGVDMEGNLDAETIIGITFPTKITMFNTGGSPPFIPDLTEPTNENEPYLAWQQAALAMETLPFVISTSYADDEQTVPPSFATTVCNNFAQFGARGVTVAFGSGDFGIGIDGNCVSNDGTNREMFIPMFPASCPFVTTVGATEPSKFGTSNANFESEIIANDPPFGGFVSGSGFSNYFPRPNYQDIVVANYLRSFNQTTLAATHGLFNASGRAYPDVAALGTRYVTIYNGSVLILDGTSCATPTVSGVLALVNDALIAARRPVLGFLNPWLYAVGHLGFTDVVEGASTGCGTSGFPAEKGWDVASGWGTPNFGIIKDLALATHFLKK